MIPILVGWGGSAKLFAYAGILKCPNCKNYGHFQLYEIAKKANVLFVPVAKWGKKYHLVCSICEGSLELTKAESDEVLQESIALPSPEAATAIWNEMESEVTSMTDETSDVDARLARLAAKLEGTYPKEHVEYVWATYAEYAQDTDQPE